MKHLGWTIAGLVLLAVVATGRPWAFGGEAVQRASRDLEQITLAFHLYRQDCGLWPPQYSGTASHLVRLESLSVLFRKHELIESWDGPYLNERPRGKTAAGGAEFQDPWSHSYQVYFFRRGGFLGPGGGIAVLSTGANGKVDSPAAWIAAGLAVEDDLVHVVTGHLDRPVQAVAPEAAY